MVYTYRCAYCLLYATTMKMIAMKDRSSVDATQSTMHEADTQSKDLSSPSAIMGTVGQCVSTQKLSMLED